MNNLVISESKYGINVNKSSPPSNNNLLLTQKEEEDLIPKLLNQEIPNQDNLNESIGMKHSQENTKAVVLDSDKIQKENEKLEPNYNKNVQDSKNINLRNIYLHSEIPPDIMKIDIPKKIESIMLQINSDDNLAKTAQKNVDDEISLLINHPFEINVAKEKNISIQEESKNNSPMKQ